MPQRRTRAPGSGLVQTADVEALRTWLRSFDMRPIKALGQNFLVDPSIVPIAVEAAELSREDHVIEVGPGPGILTSKLVEVAGRVTAVEIDERMVSALAPLARRAGNLKILKANVLGLDPEAITEGRPYKVVANLPYYITSAAIRHFLSAAHRPTNLTVMVQREVAERICAGPSDMSVLAVSVQSYAVPDIVVTVPAEAFYPVPKVESALLRLRVRHEPLFGSDQERRFFRLVRAGFHDKRKKLHNALDRNLGANRDMVGTMLQKAGVSGDRRAETLSMDEWLALSIALASCES